MLCINSKIPRWITIIRTASPHEVKNQSKNPSQSPWYQMYQVYTHSNVREDQTGRCNRLLLLYAAKKLYAYFMRFSWKNLAIEKIRSFRSSRGAWDEIPSIYLNELMLQKRLLQNISVSTTAIENLFQYSALVSCEIFLDV